MGRGASPRARCDPPGGRPGAGASEASAAEGGTHIPEAWIGRSVELVFVSGASTEYADGHLEEVNDRGIVLSVETHVGHPAQPLFYPWSAVIQLSEGQENR